MKPEELLERLEQAAFVHEHFKVDPEIFPETWNDLISMDNNTQSVRHLCEDLENESGGYIERCENVIRDGRNIGEIDTKILEQLQRFANASIAKPSKKGRDNARLFMCWYYQAFKELSKVSRSIVDRISIVRYSVTRSGYDAPKRWKFLLKTRGYNVPVLQQELEGYFSGLPSPEYRYAAITILQSEKLISKHSTPTQFDKAKLIGHSAWQRYSKIATKPEGLRRLEEAQAELSEGLHKLLNTCKVNT